jgi:hypothetical protein
MNEYNLLLVKVCLIITLIIKLEKGLIVVEKNNKKKCLFV